MNKITQTLAEMKANIVEVFHQRSTLYVAFGEAEIELDIETRGKEHTEDIINQLKNVGFRVERVF